MNQIEEHNPYIRAMNRPDLMKKKYSLSKAEASLDLNHSIKNKKCNICFSPEVASTIS